jgi:hypothetical protein
LSFIKVYNVMVIQGDQWQKKSIVFGCPVKDFERNPKIASTEWEQLLPFALAFVATILQPETLQLIPTPASRPMIFGGDFCAPHWLPRRRRGTTSPVAAVAQ